MHINISTSLFHIKQNENLNYL